MTEQIDWGVKQLSQMASSISEDRRVKELQILSAGTKTRASLTWRRHIKKKKLKKKKKGAGSALKLHFIYMYMIMGFPGCKDIDLQLHWTR